MSAQQTFNFGNVYGAAAIGNTDGTYNLSVSNRFTKTLKTGLQEALNAADAQTAISSREISEIKELLIQILNSLEKEEPPAKGALERMSEYVQRHAWIASPIAGAAIRFLESLTAKLL